MAAAVSAPIAAPLAGAEGRFLLHDVPWWMYVAMRDALEDTGVRMTYLDGSLELMSPSALHEEAKTIIARLLEAWADENDVDLRGFGSTTFRREAKKRGLEPDECYVLGRRIDNDGTPDLAIEVIVASPLLDKVEVYAGLGVPELWVWRQATRAIEVWRLAGAAYELQAGSLLLPALDLGLLARFVQPGDSHTALVKGFRAALRG
jgi:Uma2 family endonuclease